MAALTSKVLMNEWCEGKTYTFQEHHQRDAEALTQHGLFVASYNGRLEHVINKTPSFTLLLSTEETSNNPFFHGGCAYVAEDDELYITSDLLQPVDPAELPIILISRVKLIRGPMLGTHDGVQSVVWSKLRPPPNMPMPAGATSWSSSSSSDDRRAVVYCSQGKADQPGGLYEMRPGKAPRPVVPDFYGAHFGCLCAVVVVTDVRTARKAYWFLDGGKRDHHPAFRDPPELPAALWRYDVSSGLRMMTHDVRNPRGLAMSPDGETLYVTDTFLGRDDNRFEYKSQGAIYAFDVVTRSGAPFLTAKRLFALPVRGDPAGIVCDAKGHVFVGCSDGVEIFHPDGTLLGVLNVPGAVRSLGWGMEGELFICTGRKLWLFTFGNDHPDMSGTP